MTARGTDDSSNTEPLWSLELFDSWRLSRAGLLQEMRTREQRLVALLALHGTRRRGYLAGMLWPDSTEAHAATNLRAATCRIDQTVPGLLVHDRYDVALIRNLCLDVRNLVDYVWRFSGIRQCDGVSGNEVATCLPLLLQGELLPGWYDDWVIYERTRLQLLRIQGLELTAGWMLERGDSVTALVAASAAVAIEPLRESAQRMLIRVHLFEGNYEAALRDYHDFHSRMMRELGIAPSDQMRALVGPILAPRGAQASVAGADRASGRWPSSRTHNPWATGSRLGPATSPRSSPTAQTRSPP
jgi:SARP family transcriptional regulator, regulator of embCAB operon